MRKKHVASLSIRPYRALISNAIVRANEEGFMKALAVSCVDGDQASKANCEAALKKRRAMCFGPCKERCAAQFIIEE